MLKKTLYTTSAVAATTTTTSNSSNRSTSPYTPSPSNSPISVQNDDRKQQNNCCDDVESVYETNQFKDLVSNGRNGSSMQNRVSTVYIRGVPVISLLIDGKERLCLAQISNTLLKNYSYNEIHNRRVALGINCIQCTPVQLEILRRTGAMPISSRRCGMITKRESERLVKSFLEDNKPPVLPDNFAFTVIHKCGWGCRGVFYPARYNSSRAKCIRCYYCDLFYSPNKFIFHAHNTPDAKYIQPDTANFNSWRRHLTLLNPNNDDHIANAWEDVKAIFNGGTRKRMSSFNNSNSGMSSSSRSCSPVTSRAEAEGKEEVDEDLSQDASKLTKQENSPPDSASERSVSTNNKLEISNYLKKKVMNKAAAATSSTSSSSSTPNLLIPSNYNTSKQKSQFNESYKSPHSENLPYTSSFSMQNLTRHEMRQFIPTKSDKKLQQPEIQAPAAAFSHFMAAAAAATASNSQGYMPLLPSLNPYSFTHHPQHHDQQQTSHHSSMFPFWNPWNNHFSHQTVANQDYLPNSHFMNYENFFPKHYLPAALNFFPPTPAKAAATTKLITNNQQHSTTESDHEKPINCIKRLKSTPTKHLFKSIASEFDSNNANENEDLKRQKQTVKAESSISSSNDND